MHISDRGLGFLHLFIIKKIKRYLLLFLFLFFFGRTVRRGKEKRKKKKKIGFITPSIKNFFLHNMEGKRVFASSGS